MFPLKYSKLGMHLRENHMHMEHEHSPFLSRLTTGRRPRCRARRTPRRRRLPSACTLENDGSTAQFRAPGSGIQALHRLHSAPRWRPNRPEQRSDRGTTTPPMPAPERFRFSHPAHLPVRAYLHLYLAVKEDKSESKSPRCYPSLTD